MTLTNEVLTKLVTPKADKMRTGEGIRREKKRVRVNAALVPVALAKQEIKGVRA